MSSGDLRDWRGGVTGCSINAAMEQPSAKPAIEYVYSKNVPGILRQCGISLAVTTYQAQRLLVFNAPSDQKLFMLMRVFERPTGLAVGEDQLAMCTRNAVWFFRPTGTLHDMQGNALPYDLCLSPRRMHVTGDIAAHELAFVRGRPLIINTRFSCICELDEKYSFRPVWRPSFVSELLPEDRCHLSGMAVDLTGVRYVTALGRTDEKEAWRATKADGGIVIDYRTNEIVLSGLSMPHSPRLHGGLLWVLDSGRGELISIDPSSGKKQTRAKFHGFLRGLALNGNFAFVGICKIREKKTFGNLPIESMYPEFECAIYCIDLTQPSQFGFIQFTRGIEELFDIQILAGARNPHVIGMEEPTVDGVFVLPEE